MNQAKQQNDMMPRTAGRGRVSEGQMKSYAQQIKRQLQALGAVRYDLMLPETSVLSHVLQPNEIIKGVVYGKYAQYTMQEVIRGRGALVATDRRVILVDHKPLYTKCDEIAYETVSGINYGYVGFIGTVTLHTRLGDITVRTFNQNCANHFVESIEGMVLAGGGQDYGYLV